MKISVCMATYNGEKFVSEQLRTILSQLAPADEVIIVDDASGDSTCSMIEQLADNRIRIFRNSENLGVLASFEKALRHSTGEVIFLSDQDDVWYPNKVRRFHSVFQNYPAITLVISDVSVIDGDGDLLLQSRQAEKPFRSGLLTNLIKNRYTGCAMAFRRAALRYCLPFPPSIPMHDVWIGMLTEVYGKITFLDEPLIFHRRHGNNASPDKNAPYLRMLCWRMSLLYNLTRRRLSVRRCMGTQIEW